MCGNDADCFDILLDENVVAVLQVELLHEVLRDVYPTAGVDALDFVALRMWQFLLSMVLIFVVEGALFGREDGQKFSYILLQGLKAEVEAIATASHIPNLFACFAIENRRDSSFSHADIE